MILCPETALQAAQTRIAALEAQLAAFETLTPTARGRQAILRDIRELLELRGFEDAAKCLEEIYRPA